MHMSPQIVLLLTPHFSSLCLENINPQVEKAERGKIVSVLKMIEKFTDNSIVTLKYLRKNVHHVQIIRKVHRILREDLRIFKIIKSVSEKSIPENI